MRDGVVCALGWSVGIGGVVMNVCRRLPFDFAIEFFCTIAVRQVLNGQDCFLVRVISVCCVRDSWVCRSLHWSSCCPDMTKHY